MGFESAKEARLAYERLSCFLTKPVAMYCVCAVYDIPFYSEIADADTVDGYLERLKTIGHADCFENSEKDFDGAVVAGMDQQDRWITVWGVGDIDNPLTEQDYRRLDVLYKTMTAQLDAAGGVIDKQQEDAARFCSLLALKREKRVAAGSADDIKVAKDLDKMIRDNLTDCNMRKKDVLPNQKQRLDGIVDAIRQKYGVSAEMTYDDVMEMFFKWCRNRKHPQTVDAEEHALHAILKTIQKNDDMPEPSELSDDFNLANFANEFASIPNDAEKEAYNYLGMVREQFTEAGDE